MERQQLLCDGRDWKLSLTLLSSTDHVTRVTTITYDQVTVKYWMPGATSKTSYTVTSYDWKHAGDGDYSINIGASEFTQVYRDYSVSVAAPGCDTVTLNVTSWPRMAGDMAGSALATSAGLSAVSGALLSCFKKGDLTFRVDEYHNPPTPTSGDVDGFNSVPPAVGDVIVWPLPNMVMPEITVIQTVVEIGRGGPFAITWAPALWDYMTLLPMSPFDQMTVPVLRNPALLTAQSLAIPADPVSGSTNKCLKAMDDVTSPSVELCRKLLSNRMVIDLGTSKARVYDDNGVTVLLEATLSDKDGHPVTGATTGPINRTAFTAPEN